MGSMIQREQYKEYFTNHEVVDLVDMKIDDDQITMMCSVLDNVENSISTTLNLSKNKITFRGISHLCESIAVSPSLNTLILNDNRIECHGFKYLADIVVVNADFCHIFCCNNEITTDGVLDFIASCAESSQDQPIMIKSLGLALNQIGDDAAIALAGAPWFDSLEYLDMGANNLRDLGAVAIFNAMTNSESSMIELRMNFNDFGRIESISALAEMLECNTTLKILNINSVLLTMQGVAQLADALITNTTLTHLSLSSTGIYEEGGLSISDVIRENKTLESLSLAVNPLKAEGLNFILESLKRNTTLKSIDLSFIDIGDASVPELLSLFEQTHLTSIDLSGNDFNEENRKLLSQTTLEIKI